MSIEIRQTFPVLRLIWLALSSSVLAQGSFQNLGFELSRVPDLEPGQFGGWAATTDAIPGWRAWSGTNELSTVPHNPSAMGSATPAILGPVRLPGQPQVIQGSYCVQLYTGQGFVSSRESSAISQVGTVPEGTRTLIMKMVIFAPAPHTVSFNGVPLADFQLTVYPNYTLWVADLTAFAAQTGELRFTVFPDNTKPLTSLLLDGVSFSNVPIPEPGSVALLGLGMAAVVWCGRKARRG